MRKLVVSVVTGALVVGGAVWSPWSTAAPAGASCTTWTRACLVEVAKTYIAAQYDSSKRAGARVAPDVNRWENGVHNASSAEDIRGGSTEHDEGLTALLEARDVDRAIVDGDQAVVYWIMDVRNPVTGFISSAHIAERFRFRRDRCGGLAPCISEIEAIFCIGTGTAPEAAMPEARASQTSGNGILCHRAGTNG
jgi:hypothetical protein